MSQLSIPGIEKTLEETRLSRESGNSFHNAYLMHRNISEQASVCEKGLRQTCDNAAYGE